jgi:peptidoglycan hydrolase CwlO-like protein
VLVTEDMLKADYLKESKYGWQSGIKFKKGDSSKSWNTGILEVNGETYYDIRFALNAYEKDVTAREYEIGHLQDKINELKKEIEQLNNDFPSLKEAIEEWMAYQEEQKKNEE